MKTAPHRNVVYLQSSRLTLADERLAGCRKRGFCDIFCKVKVKLIENRGQSFGSNRRPVDRKMRRRTGEFATTKMLISR